MSDKEITDFIEQDNKMIDEKLAKEKKRCDESDDNFDAKKFIEEMNAHTPDEIEKWRYQLKMDGMIAWKKGENPEEERRLELETEKVAKQHPEIFMPHGEMLQTEVGMRAMQKQIDDENELIEELKNIDKMLENEKEHSNSEIARILKERKKQIAFENAVKPAKKNIIPSKTISYLGFPQSELTIVAGVTGAGKTSLVCRAMIECFDVTKKPILYISTENDLEAVIMSRIEKMGFDPNNKLYCLKPQREGLDQAQTIARGLRNRKRPLLNQIKDLINCNRFSLVVLDPFTSLLEQKDTDAKAVENFFTTLQPDKKLTQTALVATNQVVKGSDINKQSIDLVRGSSSVIALAKRVWVIYRGKDDGHGKSAVGILAKNSSVFDGKPARHFVTRLHDKNNLLGGFDIKYLEGSEDKIKKTFCELNKNSEKKTEAEAKNELFEKEDKQIAEIEDYIEKLNGKPLVVKDLQDYVREKFKWSRQKLSKFMKEGLGMQAKKPKGKNPLWIYEEVKNEK